MINPDDRGKCVDGITSADVTNMHDVLPMCRLSLFAHSQLFTSRNIEKTFLYSLFTLIRSSYISLVTPALSLAEMPIAVSSAYMFVSQCCKQLVSYVQKGGVQ